MRIEPWGPNDLPLLQILMGTPEVTRYLGGPESPEKIVERQGRYERLADSGTGRVFKIVTGPTGEAVGSVVSWERTWRDETVYEIGWSVIPSHQGRGIAGIATAKAIARARSDGKHRFMHAFPSVDNAPSNAVCRKLGFTLLGEAEFEYPPGHLMDCNDWRLDLRASA